VPFEVKRKAKNKSTGEAAGAPFKGLKEQANDDPE
jgi:hypothetical protein